MWLDLIYVRLHFIAGADDVVGPEGMEKFCEDIGVEPENVSLTYELGEIGWLFFFVPWQIKQQ